MPVYLFSQRELADGVVYFRHRAGAGDANTTIRVSDGVHVVNATVEVLASTPFVRAGNGTSLTVEMGKRVALTPANLAGLLVANYSLIGCCSLCLATRSEMDERTTVQHRHHHRHV